MKKLVQETQNCLNKTFLRRTAVAGLAVCAVLAGALRVNSQTTVQVDSTKNWIGYMNVYTNVGGTQGAYMYGSAWATVDLTAFFTSTNYVTVMPNTNMWITTNPYWVNTNTLPYVGVKWMEANFYVDVGTALQGQTVTFVGNTYSNTLASPYTTAAFIKEFASGYSYVGMTTSNLVTGSAFTVTRSIAPGHIAQYGFITTGPNADPAVVASLGKAVIAVNNADPSITALADEGRVTGQNVTFTTVATGTSPFTYNWEYVSATATNPLSTGGRFSISGTPTNTLTITSLLESDAGTYRVTVTNTHGAAVANANLSVVPLAQAQTNLLINSSFDQGPFAATAEAGWYGFNGSYLASTNDFYYFSGTPVAVVNGGNCAQTYSTGPNSYNGIFQDRPASPGEIYTANAWFLTPVEDPIGVSNVCYLEVQFRDAANVPLIQYSTALIDSNTPTSTWINLAPTNIHSGDFLTFLGTSPFMVAPAGTARVRCQVTYHADPVNDLGGSVYVDAVTLMLKAPVFTAANSGGQMQISFPTLYGPQYRAYYKTNLADNTWSVLPTVVTGDGTMKSITDPFNARTRFYIVNTQ
jgi:hypothetical protein